MSVQDFVSIQPVDVKIFYWICESFELLVALEEKPRITRVRRILPLG